MRLLNQFRLVALTGILCCLCFQSFSQHSALYWDMNALPGGMNNFGPDPYSATFTVSGFFMTAAISRGAGVGTSGTSATSAWGGNHFVESNFLDTLSSGDYVEIEITPAPGKSFSLSKIAPYNIRRSNTGPTSGQWQYSVDSGINFTNIGSLITWGSVTTQSGNNQPAIDLSSISDLQNITGKVIFRIVIWGGTNIGGTWYFNSNSSVNTGYDLLDFQTSYPLPIRLNTFSVTQKEGGIFLRWQTLSEVNNLGFIIERKRENTDWERVSFVESKHENGNGYHRIDYFFIDDELLQAGKYLYRLKQQDVDGSLTYSNEAIVFIKRKKQGIVFYPNPARNYIYIKGDSENKRLTLYNSIGQKVMDALPDAPSMRIPISNLMSGMYILKTEDGTMFKFFKE